MQSDIRPNKGHSVPFLLSFAMVMMQLLFAVGCNDDKKSETSSGTINQSATATTESKPSATQDLSATTNPSSATDDLAPGTPFPQFSLTNVAEETVTNSTFNGRAVLYNFWATWCVPCVAEMPALQKLHDKLKDQGFSVVAINIDEASNLEAVKKFVQDNNITFPVLLDPNSTLSPALGLAGYPESFIVDRSGKLLSVYDPENKGNTVRFAAERNWDSPPFIEAISKSLSANGETK